MVLFLDFAYFKRQLDETCSDYGFRYYGEMSHFVWSLLSKVKKPSELPAVEDWESYMTHKVKDLTSLNPKLFLKDHKEVDDQLFSAPGRSLFRKTAMAFVEQLIEEIVGSVAATSDIGRGLSCFSADVLIGCDDQFVFKAFGDFVDRLLQGGRLSATQVEDATNEFKSFVVEVRSSSALPSPDAITDSLSFILSYPSVFAKKSLLTVSNYNVFSLSYVSVVVTVCLVKGCSNCRPDHCPS